MSFKSQIAKKILLKRLLKRKDNATREMTIMTEGKFEERDEKE